MDPQAQFCHNPDCSERGVIGGGTVVIHSRAERRYQTSSVNPQCDEFCGMANGSMPGGVSEGASSG